MLIKNCRNGERGAIQFCRYDFESGIWWYSNLAQELLYPKRKNIDGERREGI